MRDFDIAAPGKDFRNATAFENRLNGFQLSRCYRRKTKWYLYLKGRNCGVEGKPVRGKPMTFTEENGSVRSDHSLVPERLVKESKLLPFQRPFKRENQV